MTVADTAARVRKCVRRYDTVAVGDTALLALLPHAEAREAAAVAKRLGKQLPDVAFEVTALGVRQVQELFRPRLVRS